ncbi:hypothetical protein E4U55_004380 [Claviceps digitariae]|nr:hypothetical protein E4U55_004380 [Claviceps digitariae]
MDDDGPQILRPVPRRPFNLNHSDATPNSPDDDDFINPSDTVSASRNPSGIDLPSSLRFLNTHSDHGDSPTPSLTRPQSFMNLTSSTLMGIYSEAASRNRDCLINDDDPSDTPWGTGARTPIRRPSIDETTYELMCARSHKHRHAAAAASSSSSLGPFRTPDDVVSLPSLADNLISLVLRGALLGALGLGYGLVVTRLHSEQNHLPPLLFLDDPDGVMKPGRHWGYLLFWGVGGVVLGSLLPWFDTVWADVFGQGSRKPTPDQDKHAAPGTDWALIMRAVGAFVGIIFAIRKLAWVSTLQVSATLALVNPLLWWLIDRSTSGFVFSAAVGLTGSLLLLGVNPDLVPAPSASLHRNASAGFDNEPPSVLSGLPRHEVVETGMYMLSVLFCSCLCFGNIGRRLTWNRSSGRWGGTR